MNTATNVVADLETEIIRLKELGNLTVLVGQGSDSFSGKCIRDAVTFLGFEVADACEELERKWNALRKVVGAEAREPGA